ncbi:MAG: nickel pincer cofactor biosynthesis protein LarB [Proteobacteria bacterium]|nr:nickel pincer cofactor biosynthesis protein LarB [Pseudomonadota bacterium]
MLHQLLALPGEVLDALDAAVRGGDVRLDRLLDVALVGHLVAARVAVVGVVLVRDHLAVQVVVLPLVAHALDPLGPVGPRGLDQLDESLPVADEARVVSEAFGNRTELVQDVGVSGLHRILSVRDQLNAANVVIVVAGMEGALASVVGGLVATPIIAVPTSVGYGAAFGGLSALLTMLNSCAAGVTVVNIDNGFGAAWAATMINRLAPA